MDNKELTPIQKLMLSIETTPEICFPIEINFNDGQEILEALQSQNTYNPETHVVIPKKPANKTIMSMCLAYGRGSKATVGFQRMLDAYNEAITSKGE